jgi:light-regulated signal transduction histidine kinase (bacteriophytochrome)
MVVLYSQMLQDSYAGKLDPSADQFISVIVSGALRLERLLKDLLTYSQAGSTLGPAIEVDCAEVMKEVLLNLKVSIDENGAKVHWHDLPSVQADRIGLVQLFQNLIGNAIKYRSKRPPCIEVWCERQEKDWRFAVRDNGIGIKPEYAEQVFGVFKRLHGTAYPGTGIGLAICQRIVETHGGRIWVESVQSGGSTFYFTLPVAAR